MFYVYVIFRPNGLPCYVGKGRGKRFMQHFRPGPLSLHHNRHLAAIIRAAGGRLPVSIIREALTNDQAIETEMALIAAIGRRCTGTGPLVNLTDGGEGNAGWHPAQSVRDKISAAAKRRFSDPAARAHLSAVNVGKGHTAETKAKMRASHAGKPPAWSLDPALAAKVGAKIGSIHRGKKLPPEQCRRISEMTKGRIVSEETRMRQRVVQSGKTRSAETRRRISEAKSGKSNGPHSAETRRKMREAWARPGFKEKMMAIRRERKRRPATPY